MVWFGVGGLGNNERHSSAVHISPREIMMGGLSWITQIIIFSRFGAGEQSRHNISYNIWPNKRNDVKKAVLRIPRPY